MHRAVLLFNPNAGRRTAARALSLEAAAQALSQHGIHVTVTATRGQGSAGEQALEAIASGADTIFACGGDGTVHEVVQGITHHEAASLGILPLGTANALARHLGLSLDPAEAALQHLAFEPRTVPLGHVTYQTAIGRASRFFVVMAGAGPDGMLVYNMLAAGKQRLGRTSYYARAAQLFLGKRFSSFETTTTLAGTSHTQLAVSAMAIRVGDLGGVFSPLTHGAGPDDAELQLALTAPPAYIGLPAWFALSWARMHNLNPYSERLYVDRFSCGPGLTSPVHVQADGEYLGTTPMHVELVPNALRLLMPTSPKAR